MLEAQDAQATGEGEAARGPGRCGPAQRHLGDGLRSLPTGDGQETASSDRGQYRLALGAGA